MLIEIYQQGLILIVLISLFLNHLGSNILESISIYYLCGMNISNNKTDEQKIDALTPSSVIVVDTQFLDQFCGLIREDFSRNNNRELPLVDFAEVLCVLVMIMKKMGKMHSEHFQVVLPYEAGNEAFNHLTPSHFIPDLDGKAFVDSMGEFAFAAVSSEKMAEYGDFFLDILQVTIEHPEVKEIMVIGNELEITEDLQKMLLKPEAKEKSFYFPLINKETPVVPGITMPPVLVPALMQGLHLDPSDFQ